MIFFPIQKLVFYCVPLGRRPDALIAGERGAMLPGEFDTVARCCYS
jgi:hypothetical protein